jgi:parallel beta-helix repeat protein/predicted outer membrane repeat protein
MRERRCDYVELIAVLPLSVCIRPCICMRGGGTAMRYLTHLLLAGSLIAGIAMTAPAPASAGWKPWGVEVCDYTNEQDYPHIAKTGSDAFIIAWRDYRSGGYDIYAQGINLSGDVGWQANGVPICTEAGWQNNPWVVADESGGAFILWPDQRNGSWDFYIQRVDSSGTPLWEIDGKPFCENGAGPIDFKAISDGSGGVIVVWRDSRGDDDDVYAQRISPSGSMRWTDNGIPICTAPNYQRRPDLIPDGVGGVIVTWMDNRAGEDIYAQRVDSLGNVRWTPDGVTLCSAGGNQDNPAIAPDNCGGAIITWHDKRDSFYDIYAQRVDSLGSVQWSSNGEVVCDNTDGDQDTPLIVPDGVGGGIIVWYDERDEHDPGDLYAQRIDSGGNTLWQPDGVPIRVADGIGGLRMISDSAGGAIVVWHDNAGGDYDILAQRISPSGQRLWAPNGAAVCAYDDKDQTWPEVAPDGSGGAVISWIDERADGKDIYAQRVHASEVTGDVCGPGWPVATGGAVTASPAIGNLDGTGDFEIVVGAYDGFLYVLNSDGSCYDNWPKYLGGEIKSSPALADIDTDGDMEIIVGCPGDSSLHVFEIDGSYAAGQWPYRLTDKIHSAAAVGDVDGDGDPDIVVGSENDSVYAFHADGTVLPGWPKGTGHNVFTSPALGDIDGDGVKDVVAASLDGYIHVWRGDGTVISPWPSAIGAASSSPALADIDNDGRLEIIVGSNNYFIYCLRSDATAFSGAWPCATGDYVASSPAIGDIDGDGDLEIVVGSHDQHLYALETDGSYVTGLWPCDLGDIVYSSPALADIDGDSAAEIFVGTNGGKLFVLRGDGTPVDTLTTAGGMSSSPAVGDVDGDGIAEAFVGSDDHGIHQFQTWTGTMNPMCQPWPMYCHDRQRTGSRCGLHTPVTVNVPADFSTIRQAICFTCPGDTVLVAPGTYYEHDITMRSGVALLSEYGPDSTIIDGQALGRVIRCMNADSTTTIDGFIITEGHTSGGGGGMHCQWSAPEIRNCVFLDNVAEGNGGGLYCKYSSPRLSECAFSGNSASYEGGGICCDSTSTGKFLRCEVSGNSTAVAGGGIYGRQGSSVDVDTCVFWANAATAGGGMYLARTCSSAVRASTFYGNDAPRASGFDQGPNCSSTIENTIIAYGIGGEGVYYEGEGSVITLTCCDLHSNEGGDWVGCIADQETLGGNFSADPLFYAPAEYDYRLSNCSPCVDRAGCGRIGALGPVPSRVWHVPADAPTVQAAIDSARSCDTVLVAPGIYTEPCQSTDYGPSMLVIESGIVLMSEEGPDATTLYAPDSCRVIYCSHVDSTAKIIGFTLSGGEPFGAWPGNTGGGLCCNEASPLVMDCSISGNRATDSGGGIACLTSSPTLHGCVVSGNEADGGHGGGMWIHTSSRPVISACTFSGNRCSGSGGGVYCNASGDLAVSTNTIIWGNCASEQGDEVFIYDGSSMSFQCCDINPSGVEGTGIVHWLSGNISSDPMFCEPVPCDSAPSGNGDYRIHLHSPCITGTCGQIGALGVGCGLRVWYVASTGSDLTGDGSEGDPFLTIQNGIDHAIAGDTVLVAPGLYKQTVSISNIDTLVVAGRCMCWNDSCRATITPPDEEPGPVVSCTGLGSGVTLEGFVIMGGTTGILLENSNPRLYNNIIRENDTGLGLTASMPVLINNIIDDNFIYGIHFADVASYADLTANIISRNCFGFYGVSACSLSARYNVTWNNDHLCGGACNGRWPEGSNMDKDPGYADPDLPDYHLSIDSPCIDAGDTSTVMADPDSSRNDIGAYGGPRACQDYPSYVKGLKAFAESQAVFLAWSASAEAESVSYYIVYRDTVPQFTADSANHYVDVADTAFTDTVLVGDRYSYRIAAVDSRQYQGGYSVPILVEAAPLREGVLTQSYYWGCKDQTYLRGNIVADGVGLAETGQGSIEISGIPTEAHIVRALLYWDGTPYAILNGVRLGATKIGGDDGMSAFRADIGHIFDGNGTYDVSADGYCDGASLVIVYEDSTESLRAIQINDGLDNEGQGSGGGDFDKTHFAYDQDDSVSIWYIVGGGSVGLSERYTYNGQVIAIDGCDASDGDRWDTDVLAVPSYAVAPEPGETWCSAQIRELTDSLHWIAAINVGLLLPAGVNDPNGANEYSWALRPIQPNPSGSNPTVAFDVPRQGGRVAMKIYGVDGRLVATLLDGYVEAGRHSAAWDLRNDQGTKSSPGVYFVRMDAAGFAATRKLVILE